MKIKKIIIENFKFHHHLEFEIRNNNNCLIYGENGSGKSSIYEALYSNFYYYKNKKIANGIIKIRDTFLHRDFPSGNFRVNILFNNSINFNRTDETLSNDTLLLEPESNPEQEPAQN
jgi:recombinational DNA repair ATPase RecF